MIVYTLAFLLLINGKTLQNPPEIESVVYWKHMPYTYAYMPYIFIGTIGKEVHKASMYSWIFQAHGAFP